MKLKWWGLGMEYPEPYLKSELKGARLGFRGTESEDRRPRQLERSRWGRSAPDNGNPRTREFAAARPPAARPPFPLLVVLGYRAKGVLGQDVFSGLGWAGLRFSAQRSTFFLFPTLHL
jgi:hypothetical protein